MLEPQLSRLSLSDRPSTKAKTASVHMPPVFNDLLCGSFVPQLGSFFENQEVESRMWDCFAEVYEREIGVLKQAAESIVSTEEKRRVLADILVWAEITREGYDSNTASFVTTPHETDSSFQRIGRLLRESKAARGLSL